MIQLNGNMVPYTSNMSLESFVSKEGYEKSKIAIEKNGRIVPKAEYAMNMIEDGDVIEVVTFVGGG